MSKGAADATLVAGWDRKLNMVALRRPESVHHIVGDVASEVANLLVRTRLACVESRISSRGCPRRVITSWARFPVLVEGIDALVSGGAVPCNLWISGSNSFRVDSHEARSNTDINLRIIEVVTVCHGEAAIL